MDRQDVNPGDSMPAAWIRRGCRRSRRMRKSANGTLRPVQLRPDATAAQAQILDPQRRKQLARRLEKRCHRQPRSPRSRLSVLEADGRSEGDSAVQRLRQMHAEAVTLLMRNGVDETLARDRRRAGTSSAYSPRHGWILKCLSAQQSSRHRPRTGRRRSRRRALAIVSDGVRSSSASA